MSSDRGDVKLIADDCDERQRIIVTSTLKELAEHLSALVERNAALNRQLKQYRLYDEWNRIDRCPLCQNISQPTNYTANQPCTKSSVNLVDKRDCVSKKSITKPISDSDSSEKCRKATSGVKLEFETSPEDRSERSKLKLNGRKRKLGDCDSSPEKRLSKKYSNLLDEEVKFQKPIGRVLVPETCPNDSLDLIKDVNSQVPETVAFDQDFVCRKKGKNKTVKEGQDSEFVSGHGFKSQIDPVNVKGFNEPGITSTPVNWSEKSEFRKYNDRDRDYAPLDQDDDENGILTQVLASSRQKTKTVENSVKSKAKPDDISTILEERSSFLFENSLTDDNKSSPCLLKQRGQNDKENIYDDNDNDDDDGWLSAVKEQSQKKQNSIVEKRVLSELKNTTKNTSSPNALTLPKHYRQQSILGLIKQPKVDISTLEAFSGGCLNSKPTKSDRSPLKIKTEVDCGISPIKSPQSPFSDQEFTSQGSDASVNVLDLRPALLEKPLKTMTNNERPRLVRQNAVDYDDVIMDVDTCASVRFGAGARHAVMGTLDSPFEEDSERPPMRRRSSCENPRADVDSIQMEFDEARDHLDLDSQEVKDELIFKVPNAPQRDMDETMDSSFDRVPSKSNDVDYAYYHTDRRKAVREKLPGFDCPECKRYFDAAGVPEEERANRLSTCSRHRNLNPPPSTPPGFWDLGFPPTPKQRQRQEERQDIAPEARARRKRGYEMPDRDRKKCS